MKPRQHTVSALLARIRGYDFESRSDAGLKAASLRLQSGAHGTPADGLLPAAFAIVAEAIDRRLGAWRLFGDSSLATPEKPANPADERVIAETVADVAQQRKYRRPGDILLPLEFYRAARRQDRDGRLRFRATDEQLMAGIHLFRGKVVQMDAGEGKTVAVAFPAALHAMLGNPAHVVTANDYLAERDAALLEPVYQSLGLSVGAILGYTEDGERRHVYRQGIVYGSMRELGFDFLRDNLKSSPGERVQQRLEVAIVDEADHALIDEAFIPMIISGNPVGGTRSAVRVNGIVSEMIDLQRGLARELAGRVAELDGKSGDRLRLLSGLLLAEPDNPALLQRFAANPRLLRPAWALAEDEYAALTAELYYAIYPGNRFVTLAGKGRDFLEQRLGDFHDGAAPDDFTDGGNLPLAERRKRADGAARRLARQYGLANQVSQALRAHLLLQRDVDYLVDDDGIVLIDQHTGRPKPDSIYQHGLQSALEAKEGVAIRPECETLAQISVAGFLSRYGRISGITGTAAAAAGEFRRKYGLEVAVLPSVNPPLRVDRPPKVFTAKQDKIAAVADEVIFRHRLGQPVLVGTRTVEQSEELSRELWVREAPHRVLNAVTTHAEAQIVRDAGAFGAVTVATHMAGRGTDILLEPGLNARIARQCADEIHRLLTDETGDAGAVDVSCPSPKQAAALWAELDRSGLFHTAQEAGGELRVTLRGGSGERGGQGRLEFALGLCVIGTEIHDSSRIRLQLNGRSGRQGEFGLTQTFLSLEDRLVNLDADGILRFAQNNQDCRQTDAAGRPCFTGPEVTRRIEKLQAAAEREGEVQRGLIQDYAAEFDRQTHLYYQRRQNVILSASKNPESIPGSITEMSREVAGRVASRLAAKYCGQEAEEAYSRRFGWLAEEARLDYEVDCSSLYGLDLSLLPEELAGLLAARLERQESLLSLSKGGANAFPELARLLFLQVSGELWPGHVATLRDLIACQLLSSHNHKSAVAQYVHRSAEAWQGYWERVDAEFLSRLTTFPLAAPAAPAQAPVSEEVELLLAEIATVETPG